VPQIKCGVPIDANYLKILKDIELTLAQLTARPLLN
jgi:hypothetical protein